MLLSEIREKKKQIESNYLFKNKWVSIKLTWVTSLLLRLNFCASHEVKTSFLNSHQHGFFISSKG